jgi:hypothetical protein
MKRLENLRKIFKELSLPENKMLIAGSTPLCVFNIIAEKDVTDFDVIVTDRKLWKHLEEISENKADMSARRGGQIITLNHKASGEIVEFINIWPVSGKEQYKLHQKKIEVDGLSYMSLEHIIRYKLSLKRPKDMEHLSKLRIWLRNNPMHTHQGPADKFKTRLYRDIARGFSDYIPK